MKLFPGLALLAALALGPAAPCAAAEPGEVRPAALAGTWYAGDGPTLQQNVDAWLKAGKPGQALGRVVAIIAPHAGHRYCGAVAGAAWAAATGMSPAPDTVVLVGPSHHFALPAPGIWPAGAFATPLGPVAINQALAERLGRRLGATPARQAHLREHSLEVELPFLVRALPQATLVPILTTPPSASAARELGLALAEAARGGKVLLAVSTDLSHFHSEPEAQSLDAQVAQRVEALDPQGLLEDESLGRAEACGVQALAAVLWAAKELGATRGVILAQATSAQATGERSSVVGYMAAALIADGPPPSPAKAGLDPAQRTRLRALAAAAVKAAVKGEPAPAWPQDDPALTRPAGVFVTLKKNHDLRGCIGTVLPRLPLAQAVVEMAAAAALHDPRFLPVRPQELGELSLELSVLTPFEPCTPEQVRLGQDGLMIEGRGRKGLLLPQVPEEMGWDLPQYLEGICQKAGLPPQAWKGQDVKLYRFQAEVF